MTVDITSIAYAFEWCKHNHVDVPLPLMVQARKAGVAAKARLPGDYKSVRDTYWAAIYDAVEGFMNDSQGMVVSRNQFKKAMVDAFVEAGDAGYAAGGSEPL
jgi:hypothetical protein